MNINQFRQAYPQYGDLSDDDLAQRLYDKHYSDKLTFEDFNSRFRPPAESGEEKGGFLDALGAGVDTLQIAGLSAAQGAARSVGADEFAEDLQGSIEEQERQRAEALPDQMMFTEAESAGDVWQAFKEAAGTSLPISAPGIVGGAIGGGKAGAALGTMLGPVGTVLGGLGGTVIGGIIGGTIPFYGLNRERQKEVYGEVKNELAAAGTAIPQAAADALISRMVPGVGTGFRGGVISRIMKGIGGGAATEAPTEVVQQVLERAQAGLDILSEDAMAEYKEAAIAGAALGAGFGGVTGPFNRRVEDAPPNYEEGADEESPEGAQEEQRMQTAEEARKARDDYRTKRSEERKAALLVPPSRQIEAQPADRVLEAEAERRSMYPTPNLPDLEEEVEADTDQSIFEDEVVRETTAELSAQAQAKNIRARPDEEIFVPDELGSFASRVAGYFSIRQPGKQAYSVNDLKDAGLTREDIDAIAEQKDSVPDWATPDSAQAYEIRGKAIAKARGYGTSSSSWKKLVQDLTGKDTVSDIPLKSMSRFFRDLNELPDKTPEVVAQQKEAREKLDVEEREALAEGLYQKIIGKFRKDGVVDIPSITRSKEEGGMGIAQGEARKVIEAAEKRGDLRQVNGEYALDISMGPRVQGTPEPAQPGQEERLRIEETASRVTPDYKGADAGWTFERDGIPQKIYPTRKAATEARNAAFKAGSQNVSSVFKGRPGYTVFRDVVENGDQVNIAPLASFDTIAEADAAASELNIPMSETQVTAKRKRDAKRRLERLREVGAETRKRWKAALDGPQQLTTNADAKWSGIKSTLRQILDGMGMEKVALQIGRFKVDVEGQFVEPDAKYANGVIRLAMDLEQYEGMSDVEIMNFMAEVMDHEIIHALKVNKAFTEQQWKTLVEAGKTRKIKVGDQEMTFWDYQKLKIGEDLIYEGTPQRGQVLYGSDIYQEEVVADMFREWAKNGGKFPGAPASIFRKIMKLLRGIARALKDNGFRTADEIFGDVQSGAIAAQENSMLAPDIATSDFEALPLAEQPAGDERTARASRIGPSMYEYKMRVSGGKEGGGKTITRRVMATDPKDARRKALEQMKRTKGAYEVQDIKEWKPLVDRLSRKMPEGVPETAQRYSRRQVADRARFENTADFEKWFSGAHFQDKDGNPVILYHGTRAMDESGQPFDTFQGTSRDGRRTQLFFAFDPEFTTMFSQPEYEVEFATAEEMAAAEGISIERANALMEAPRSIPVITNVKKPFDPKNAKHWDELRKSARDKGSFDRDKGAYNATVEEQAEMQVLEDTWYRVENSRSIMEAIDASDFDSAMVMEDGNKNLMLFDPKQVKSIFNRFEEGAAESARYSRRNPLADFIMQNPEGFTVSVDGETVPQTGYVVAPLKQTEIILSSEDVKNGNLVELYDMVEDLETSTGTDAYAGGWLNEEDGKYYLDAVSVIDDYEQAVYTALSGDQIAIFNLDNFEVVNTEEAVNGLKQSGAYSPEREANARAKNAELGRRFEEKRAQRGPGGGAEGGRYSRIAGRYPEGAKRVGDPLQELFQVGAADVLNTTEANRQKLVQNLKSYPGFKTRKRTPEAVVEEFQEFVVRNLLFLHDQVDPSVRQRSKLWYDGARNIVDRWQQKYGLQDYQIAGVLASLSPQKDWYQNVSLAERVLDIHTRFTRGNMRGWFPDAAMVQKAQELYLRDAKGRPKTDPSKDISKALMDHVMSKPYMDITHDNPAVEAQLKAMWTRVYDQTYNDRAYRTVTPEGNFVGDPSGITAWGSNSEIGKAIRVIEGRTLEEVSEAMGSRHKIRNFFNNIVMPNSDLGEVTIDTHAMAAGLMRALSGNSFEVLQGFGTAPTNRTEGDGWVSAHGGKNTGTYGYYGIYADAYREAARRRGILPREMQSITWEAVRGLFPKDWKTAANVATIDNIWREFERGDITLNQAHQLIMEASPNGGVGQPTWLAEGLPASSTDEGVENSSYRGELSGPGVPGRYSRRTPGTRPAPSASERLITAPDGSKTWGMIPDRDGEKRYKVQIDRSRFEREVMANRDHKGIGRYAHIDNFARFTPARSREGVLKLLKVMLDNFAIDPKAPEFRSTIQKEGDLTRTIIHWKNDAFKTPDKELRLVLEERQTPVGVVREFVTFFPVVPTYQLKEESKDLRFSRVPRVTNESTLENINDLSLNQAQGMVGMAIQKMFRNGPMQKFRINYQDKMLPVQQLLTRLKQNNVRIDDKSNVYLQETLMHGALGDAHHRQDVKLFRPVLKAIANSNVSFEELGEYLMAQHAAERNAYVESIGGAPGGSGIRNPDAFKRSIEGKLAKKGTLEEARRLAGVVRKIIDNTNEIRLKAGLISREQYEAGMAAMPNYVPMRGKKEDDIDPDSFSAGGSRMGGGVQVRGREDLSVTGRQDMAPPKDVVAHIISQNKIALSRAYRNNVARSVYNLAVNNPENNMVKLITEDNKREYFTEKVNVGGKIIHRVDPYWKNHSEMFWLKVDGRDVGVHFPGSERVVASLRAIDNPVDIGPGMKFLLGFNRFLANVNTSWNPEFLLTNLVRDIQTAGVMANAAEVKGLSGAILKDVLPALRAVRASLREGKVVGELGRSFEEMRRAGGTTEYMGINDLDTTLSRMESEIRDFQEGGLGKSRKMFKDIVEFVEDYNKVAENATRLATFHNARKRGLSTDQAAYLAKNITVNFNRGGTKKSQMNALFLFYNASLQGTHAMWHAIKRSKKMQAVMGGIIAAGFTSDLVNSMMSDEDDDGRLIYDKLPDYVLQRNMVFMLPRDEDAKPFAKFPMPYGFNAFFNFGRVLSKLTRGGYTSTLDAAGDALLPMIDSFNPLGGASSLLNFVAPTVFDPLVDIYTNKDFANRPIVPEAKNPYAKHDQPYSQRFWNSTAQPFKDIAAWMNELTGGSEFEKGAVDMSPEVLEYMYDYALGGLGKFAIRVGQLPGTVSGAIDGDWSNVEANSIPIARQLVGNVTNRNDVELYIQNSSDVLTKLNAYEGFVDLGLNDSARNYLAENKDKIRLGKYIQKIDRQLSDIRTRETKIKANNNISDEKKEELLKVYREQKDRLITNANKLYFAIED